MDIGTGFTPLVKTDNLGDELGLDRLYIKNDCLNPTYSFKDRSVLVAVTKAQWETLKEKILKKER